MLLKNPGQLIQKKMRSYYCLFICLLPFLLVAQNNLLNGDFEQWPDVLYDPIYDLEGFGAVEPARGIPAGWKGKPPLFGGVSRVTNSHNGDYAVLVYTYYNYNEGALSQTVTTEQSPTHLRGYYQYHLIDAGYEEAIRKVEITAWQGTDVIGRGHLRFDTTSTYQAFEVPIVYEKEQLPDSLTITFTTNGLLSSGTVSGFLYLDDLEFTYEPVSSTEGASGFSPTIECYPNPAKEQLFIQKDFSEYGYQIVDISGTIIKSGKIGRADTSLYLGDLTRGIFLLLLESEQGRSAIQKIYVE